MLNAPRSQKRALDNLEIELQIGYEMSCVF